MHILVLGGTRFIGHHIVLELLRSGHTVTTLNRGLTPDDLPAQVKRLRGDRDRGTSGLSELHGQKWDACVDVSGYTAVHTKSAADELQGRIGRYIFISAVSVYGDSRKGPIGESAGLVDAAPEDVTEVIGDMYGRLKVTCERIVCRALGDRATILRPQVVVGPLDPTPRLTYWIRRARQSETMLTPGDGSDFLQVIDVHDIARFASVVIERDLPGTYNLSGERLTWSSFIDMLAPQNVFWVTKTILEEARLSFMDLPLYRATGAPRSGLMHVSNDRAVQAGLVATPMRTTLEQVRGWMAAANPDTEALKPDIEQQLIERARKAA
jgi:2'-hydroxyisoflavone reductase